MNEELPKMVHASDVKKPLPANDSHSKIAKSSEIAKPLYYQQLERSLNLQPALSSCESLLYGNDNNNDDLSSDSDSEVLKFLDSKGALNGIVSSKHDLRSDRMRLYNFAQVNEDRAWLQDLLVDDSSDSSDDKDDDTPITEEDLQTMLKMHLYNKKYQSKFYTNPENRQYQYYGAGLLSNYDKFPEHQMSVVGSRKKRKAGASKRDRIKKEIKEEKVNSHSLESHDMDGSRDFYLHDAKPSMSGKSGMGGRSKSKKKSQNKDPEVMAYRRRKIWSVMAKKEVGKVQRSRTTNHKEVLTSCRRVAQYCMRYWRQKAMQSQRNMKETVWRAKRLTREMQTYWKRCDRVERETRKRMEKEAEEQRKMDVELMEAKRQQRKLNFLITQTELYAHFMSRKLGGASAEEQLRILSQLEEEKNPRLAAIDDYDSETVKETVRKNVQSAFNKEFHGEKLEDIGMDRPDEERPQPSLFKGSLKGYQLKGMNWLANLYDQGINGILADEMGLGKTVQSIAFLCHIAEKYSFWGPFLIISPASTLHNWQQEMARFVPDFKVVPYWGSPQDRKILRQFWDVKGLHTKEASFHVVITSYQLVVTDFKYFNRFKWQYMILDEAQALKSTNSMRWKLLLGFSCRNRLLLSGTPIQNSMAELWALLHFIMPTMFDSHDEFNEWFSKDIESHAENKTSIDEKHLSRLHMILKPFMLRRIKKDVENELSDKIEVMVYCPLTTRQKMLYAALKKKIRIEDLLHYSGQYQSAQSITSNLMNLVMQFRKVCNHPELFERREAKSPFFMRCLDYVIPQLVFKEGLLHRAIPSIRHLLYNHLSIMNPNHVHRTLFPQTDKTEISSNCDSAFSFTRFIDLSPEETFRLTIGGLTNRLLHLVKIMEIENKFNHCTNWWENEKIRLIMPQKRYPQGLVFTAHEGHTCVFSHVRNVHYSCAETIEHRLLRSRKAQLVQLAKMSAEVSSWPLSSSPVSVTRSSSQSPTKKEQQAKASSTSPVAASPEGGVATIPTKLVLLPEFRHVPRSPRVLECYPTVLPSFVYNTQPKIQVGSRDMYASCSEAAWWLLEHNQCSTKTGQDVMWYGSPEVAQLYRTSSMYFTPITVGGLSASSPLKGWSNINIPDKQTLVTDAGKLYVLDNLLKRLKEQGHRVLIYSQMTRMIDLLEEYMWYRKLTYMRLDGSSKISDRRDMVADFQSRDDIFVFLLSTRAGGLGINLTAADTVIFYDSDWNPTVDQQAMDRAHRLGQTKQVTVYRLICKDTIEERILQRAREKSEIQRMVISGGDFKPDTLKPKEVVSLLLDDDEIEQKYRQKQAERRQLEESRQDGYKEREKERKRKNMGAFKEPVKHTRVEETVTEDAAIFGFDSAPASPAQSDGSAMQDDTSSDALVVDIDATETVTTPVRPPGMKTRGRPRSRRGMPGRSPASPNLTAAHYQLSPRGTSVKRGPGRPRLKPMGGPAHQGSRGAGVGGGGGHFMAGLTNLQSLVPPQPSSEPIKPFGYYTQDLELVPLNTDDT
ncbi:chromatin-remodeling ATPase INO80 [Nilaparvata lugens]|uniref:chromatin-remodeling ATPase INO80 n=1 Tax=Nilaparvata lugens TaxID=108931 RepID=UPI00193EAEC9|nr:chromatin-remodeling ATPase INO80 [Nilaparvata lugens]XP_039288186.1 chromatin-remodeling ATPase INO80 [Nilaparvata lugens]